MYLFIKHFPTHSRLIVYENLLYYVLIIFEGTVCRQIDDVIMGSPLGPVLADVVLSVIQTKLNDCISKLVLYKRFVDDVLIFIDSTNCVNIV